MFVLARTRLSIDWLLLIYLIGWLTDWWRDEAIQSVQSPSVSRLNALNVSSPRFVSVSVSRICSAAEAGLSASAAEMLPPSSFV